MSTEEIATEARPAAPGLVSAVVQVFSLTLVSKGLQAAAGLLAIRVMVQDEYALFTFCASVTTAAAAVISGSLNRIYITGFQELGLDNDPSPFLGMQVRVIAAFAVLLIPLVGLVGALYPLVVLLLLGQCLSDYAQTAFQQGLRFFSSSLVDLTRSVALVAALLGINALVQGGLEAGHLLLIQALTLLGAFLASLGPRLDIRAAFHVGTAWRLALRILRGPYRYLFGYTAVFAVFAQLDVWVLKGVGDTAELATYGAAQRYYYLLLLPLTAVHTVLLPHIQRLRSVEDLRRLYAKHQLILALFIPAVVVGLVLAGWVMPWIDGGRYPESVAVFRVLAISAVVSFAFSPHGNLLLRFGDYRFVFLLIVALLPVHLGLNLLAATVGGPFGVALVNLTSYALFNGLVYLRAGWLVRVHWGPGAAVAPAPAEVS